MSLPRVPIPTLVFSSDMDESKSNSARRSDIDSGRRMEVVDLISKETIDTLLGDPLDDLDMLLDGIDNDSIIFPSDYFDDDDDDDNDKNMIFLILQRNN
jgi:hypothetical protein